MPKTKKKWINGKDVEKYRLIHRVQHSAPEECDGIQNGVSAEEMEERSSYGIYFYDDYDYMKHLRAPNEASVMERVDSDIVQRTENNSGAEIHVEKNAESIMVDDEDCLLDPDIVSALSGNLNFNDAESALDDDFVLVASGGKLPVQCADEGTKFDSCVFPCERGILRLHDDGVDDNEGTFADQCSELAEDDFDRNEKINASLTSSNVNRTSVVDLIGGEFDKICENYGSDGDSEEMEQNETEFSGIEPTSLRIKQLAEEFNETALLDNLQPVDTELKKTILSSVKNALGETCKSIHVEPSGPKKIDWDCESILTTYSNASNHPSIVEFPALKRAIKRKLNCYNKLPCPISSPSSIGSVSTSRQLGETLEEKKSRKSAVKQLRRARRLEKKNNRNAFGAELLRIATERNGPGVKVRYLD